jgi:ABC-type transport system involved in multi-copper enzyme maturation permease subunit/regulation of enolase protein 1 (concanavalin A-like superfamily)
MSMTSTPPGPPVASPGPPSSGGGIAVLWSEWVKFRTVRGWLIGLVLAGLLCVVFTFVVANGNHQSFCTGTGNCSAGHPFVPDGPDGEAVADSYQYYARPLTGNGTLTVRISSLTGLIYTGPSNRAPSLARTQPKLAAWTKAGILITPSTRQGSAYAAVMATGSHGLRFQYDYRHDHPGLAGVISGRSPRWLRLTRAGDTITGYDSTDGSDWQEIATARLPGLPATVNVGLFATSPVTYQKTSAEAATRATATFDHLSLTGTSASGAWTARSIGMSPQNYYPILGAGSAQRSGTSVTIAGSGDIAPAVATLARGNTDADTLLFGIIVALIVVIVIATGFITSEYRRGLMHTTLIATPQRSSVLAAKALVIAVVAFVLGAVAAAVALPLGHHVLNTNGNYIFPTSTATQLRVITGTGLLLALTAVGVLALGTILRRAAGAVTIGITVFVLPGLLGPGVLGPGASGASWLYQVSPAAAFSVFGALPRSSLVDFPVTLANGYYPIGPWAGLAVLAAYAAAALALATYLLHRRDA